MCPNIKYAELHQQDEIQKAVKAAELKADLEKVSILVEHLSNPKSKALDMNVIPQLTFENFLAAFTQFKTQLTSSIGNDVNPDLKKEVQDKLINEQKDVAQNAYAISIDRIQSEMESYKRDLLREIKSKKFPNYNANIKEYLMTMTTVSRAPDQTARLIGATELSLAANTPLKYITPQLLENYWLSGRIDLVSALVERFALNQMEFKIDEAMKLQEFGLKFYESIGVQSSRQILRYLNSFLQVIALNKVEGQTTAQLFGEGTGLKLALQLQTIQTDFEKSAGWDNLLES